MCCPKEVGCPKDVVYTVIFYLSTYYSLPALPFSTFHFTTHSPCIIFNLTLLLFITFNLTPQPSFTFCFFLYSPSLYQNIPPILFKLATLPYFEIPSHFPDLLFLSLTFPSLYYIPPITTFLFITFYLYSSTLPFIIFHILSPFPISPLLYSPPFYYIHPLLHSFYNPSKFYFTLPNPKFLYYFLSYHITKNHLNPTNSSIYYFITFNLTTQNSSSSPLLNPESSTSFYYIFLFPNHPFLHSPNIPSFYYFSPYPTSIYHYKKILPHIHNPYYFTSHIYSLLNITFILFYLTLLTLNLIFHFISINQSILLTYQSNFLNYSPSKSHLNPFKFPLHTST